MKCPFKASNPKPCFKSKIFGSLQGLGSLQSRLARMLHHEYDVLKGYRFLGGAISFYSVSCMSDVIFNPSLLNWSSLILTVAHIVLKWYNPIITNIFSNSWSLLRWNAHSRLQIQNLRQLAMMPVCTYDKSKWQKEIQITYMPLYVDPVGGDENG